MRRDITLCAVGADDEISLRELTFARLLAMADEACRCREAGGAARARDFEVCMRSIATDPRLADLYERLVPVRERVRRHHPLHG